MLIRPKGRANRWPLPHFRHLRIRARVSFAERRPEAARRYHSTVDPNQRLTALSNGLLKLHKHLLDSEREVYERGVARITSPGHFLRLLLEDPHFEWLRELSQMVVLIDETVAADEPTTTAEAERLLKQSRELVTPSEHGTRFGKRYYEAMQRDPNVVLAHSEMLKTFSSL
jgi:hypothetical protein